MKKLFCLILSAILCFTAAGVAVCAKEEVYPVVFVPGFTGSRMYLDRGTDEEKVVWKIHVGDEIVEAIKKEIPAVAATAGFALTGNYTPLFDVLKPYADEVLEGLRMQPDGTSKYPVEVYPHAVEDTRLDALDAIGFHPDHETALRLGEAVGKKNVYSCTLDWRLGQVENAAVLNAYIDEVLSVTGAKKVNLLGTSFGGQVTATYLTIYGGEKVHNAVLHCPAVGGSSLVPQLLSGEKVHVGWSDLLRLYGAYSKDERDFAQITDVVSPEFLDGFLQAFVNYYLKDFFLNFGSVWDFVPLHEYASLRDALLRDGKHDKLIEKSDYYHYEVSAKQAEAFKRLRAEGVGLSIVAGHGFELAVANGTDSDGVIDLSLATGAKVAKLGEKLTGIHPAPCSDLTHCHVSPEETVDASVGYLPEHTWYVRDLLHGLAVSEEKANRLVMKLLCTDTLPNVYADPEYPQFMYSENRCRGVVFRFLDSAEGTMTPYSKTLEIRNVSKKNSVVIDGISCKGAKLSFSYEKGTTLLPGETMTATVCGTLPSDLSTLSVTVRFVTVGEKLYVASARTEGFRFICGALLEKVRTTDCEDPIENISAVKTGHVSPCVFFARVLYFLMRIIGHNTILIR